MGLFEDEYKRAQQWRAGINARDQLNQATADYTNTVASASDATTQAESKKTGVLESVIKGIADSVKNTGESIFDMFGKGGAAVRDIFTGNATTGKYQKEWDQYMKGNYGDENMSDKDFATKRLGKGIDAASTLLDLIPGVGSTAKVALNMGQGAASGVAQNLIDNGENATLEDSLKGALTGAASAGVGQYVGGKLASKTAGSGALSKALNSNVGKAAITGATSGATAGGLGTALQGGSVGDTLAGALQGAGMGAAGGATTASALGLLGTGAQKLNAKVAGADTASDTTTKAALNPAADTDTDAAKATGWGEKDMTGSAKKRSVIRKLGDTLQETGQMTKDNEVYSKLKGNTAEEMSRKNSVQRLKDIGFSPSDYKQAADLSEVANKTYSDAVKASTATAELPSVYKLAEEIADDLNMDADSTAKVVKEMYGRLDAARVQGRGLHTFSAAGLEDVADQIGKKAKKMTTTSEGGSKAANGTLKPEDEKYAQVLTEVKKALRGEVNDMVASEGLGDSIKTKLKDAGATDKQIKYLTQDGNLSGLKARTSLLEDARTMNQQMKSDSLKRGANATDSTSMVTRLANASGAGNALDLAMTPVRKTVGAVEQGLGKVVNKVADATDGWGVGNKLASVAGALNNDTLANKSLIDTSFPTMGELATSQIARQAGRAQIKNQEANRDIEEAQQAVNNAEEAYNNALTNYDTVMSNLQAQQTSSATSQIQSQLETIGNAMNNALAVGDLTSYSTLADLYEQAYDIYSAQAKASASTTSSSSSLSDSQRKALAAKNQLETLTSLTPTAKTAMSNVPVLSSIVGITGGDKYYSAAKALESTLTYMLSGASSSDAEKQSIRDAYIPQVTDSEETRQQKLAAAQQVINEYLSGTIYAQ